MQPLNFTNQALGVCHIFQTEPRKPKSFEVMAEDVPDLKMANAMVADLRTTWEKSKKGRKAVRRGLDSIFYFSDSKVAFIVTIEPLPTEPSKVGA